MKHSTTGLSDRLVATRSKIDKACAAVGRDGATVRIVAVTKGFGPAAVEAALHLGLTDIGENYYQEAAAKFAAIDWPANGRKHFIGRVQRNKAAKIAELFDVVQTVDSLDAAQLLSRRAAELEKYLDILVQVNVASDQRQGVPPASVNEFARDVAGQPNLRVRGLMAMGPADRASAQAAFERAHTCFLQLQSQLHGANILSMGMSDDYDFALAHGATMLRLGTVLFGPRPQAR